MKKALLLILLAIITSCSKETSDLVVKVNIQNLKKGTIYLRKQENSKLITIDSLDINGNSTFELHSKIESPEVFFLYLDKNSSEEDRIAFFADKGITQINTSLKRFVYDAKITGSPQQKLWEDYKKIASRFNDINLDLIKENIESQKNGDTSQIARIQKEYDNNLKRRYLYTVNFAVTNKDSEVAPYLALTEVYNAQIKLLDTINNSLTPKVKASKYGKELQTFINKIKIDEK